MGPNNELEGGCIAIASLPVLEVVSDDEIDPRLIEVNCQQLTKPGIVMFI